MALLLVAVVLPNVQNRLQLSFQLGRPGTCCSSCFTSSWLPGHWVIGAGDAKARRVLLCTRSSEAYLEGTETVSLDEDAEEAQVTQEAQESPESQDLEDDTAPESPESQDLEDDKAGNPWLELTTIKTVRKKKPEHSLNDALRRFLFVTPDGRKQSKWIDRRTAVLVVQNASSVESALTRVGDKLEVPDLNLLLRRFSNLERWEDACQLFVWMEKEKRISGASYSTFIILLGKLGRITKAFHLYNSLSDELKLNPYIANSMLSALVHNWKVSRAFRLFRKLKQSEFTPDYITYSTMLCACMKIHNGYQKSQLILEDMKAKGFKPDICAYGSLLRVYCSNGLEDKAKALVEEMSAEGVVLTLYHYSYLMNMYARLKKPDEAEKIFTAIKEAGLEPNQIIYRSLINVYGSNRMLEQAKKTMEDVKACGMQPDVFMYTFLMDAYISMGKVYEAHELLVEMRRKGVRPAANAYSILISGYGSLGDFDMVTKLAAESESRRKGKQDVRLFNALLKSYSQLKHDDGITNTLERMDTEAVMPNKGSFNILIEYLCKKRMFGLALRTYRDMKSRGLKPNGGTYSRLLTGLLNPLLEDRPQSKFSQILERTKDREIDLLAEAYNVFKDMLEAETYCHESALERYIEVNALSKSWPVAVEALEAMKKASYTTSPLLLESLLKLAVEDDHYGVMTELMRIVKLQGSTIDFRVLERVKLKFMQLDQTHSLK